MKTNQKFYIGVDVSKPFFDAALLRVVNHEKQGILEAHFDNTDVGLKSFGRWLGTHGVSFDSDTLLVIENTGIYHRKLWEFCNKNQLPIHIGNAAHIKWSFGIARGKNDKIDALRLAKYAFKEAEELQLTSKLKPELLELKDLQTARNKLVVHLGSNQTYLNELKLVKNKTSQNQLEQVYQSAIEGVKKSIKGIEKLIKKLIYSDDSLAKNYELLLSIPGIGSITAVYLLSCTNNFAGSISGKQLACYAGVVPFGNTSGISVKGKEKVHKMANKELKRLLHLCAISALKNNEEIKTYYERKVKEGKPKMSVINALKNKLVLRAAAVIRNQQPFVDNYKYGLENQKKTA